MLLRLTSDHGGDGTVHGIIAMNDTGSDMLTLFNADLAVLGNIQGYSSWQVPTGVIDANGTTTVFPTIVVQVRLVREENTPWGNWVNEVAIVKQLGPNVPQLSGIGIRGHWYIGTAPGNHLLAVGTTEGGLNTFALKIFSSSSLPFPSSISINNHLGIFASQLP
jgi:hypothetical protein